MLIFTSNKFLTMINRPTQYCPLNLIMFLLGRQNQFLHDLGDYNPELGTILSSSQHFLDSDLSSEKGTSEIKHNPYPT